MKQSVVIIGAGVSGLYAATLLENQDSAALYLRRF